MASSQPVTEQIIRTMQTFIEQERKRTFSFLANHSHEFMKHEDLLAVSVADAGDVEQMSAVCEPSTSNQEGIQWFTFTEVYETSSLDHTVAITVSSNSITSIDDLEVFDPMASQLGKQSIGAADWIRATYDWSENLVWEMKNTEHQYHEQRIWWSKNAQYFKLLELPLELREAVYLQIIGPIVVLDLHRSQLILGRGLKYSSKKQACTRRDPDLDKPNMGIMRICKQVYKEALAVATRDTTKRLCTLGDSDQVAAHRPRQPEATISDILKAMLQHRFDPSFLRTIQLEMSATQYFLSVGIAPSQGNPWRRLSPRKAGWQLSHLQYLRGLQHLDFRFMSPKNPAATCPWALAAGQPNSHSCQKIWIDWFFVFAWPILSDFNTDTSSSNSSNDLSDDFSDFSSTTSTSRIKFSLSGCVKTSTQIYWQDLLNNHEHQHNHHHHHHPRHSRRSPSSPTTHAQIKARRKEITTSKMTDGPIPCACSTSCPPSSASSSRLFQCSEYEISRIEGLREEIDKAYWDYDD